ncbi:dsDNA nuclease domain-containing protein [Streptomyces umbrinus]|uniref:dsDNA nuclease domain-containing protein n=1 Tax=Streptomyces umbrinus TaxID=67370 RepID=UPI00343B334A
MHVALACPDMHVLPAGLPLFIGGHRCDKTYVPHACKRSSGGCQGVPMALAPADGGRRSRRGFAYQEVVTLLDCLDMLDGQWTSVSWEDLEDTLCYRDDEPNYRQVKTIEEAGTRHSVASICRPETAQKMAKTSYLGKLFLDKPLPEGTRFTLVINEMPQRDLHEFAVERDQPRGPVSDSTRNDVIARLDGLQPPDGRDIGWCVDRLDVLVAGRTIEDVEREALHRLAPHVGAPRS